MTKNEKEVLEEVIRQATPRIRKEILVIIDSFYEWRSVYEKAVVGGNNALGKKLPEICERTAKKVSVEAIMRLGETTKEMALNDIYLRALLIYKKRQAS